MKLTVYCITRNEAASLPLMWNSVKQIADEFLIVDTGSTDNTIEVAKSLTDYVFEHPRAEEWRENPGRFDFSEARNYAIDLIEQGKPDWILSMDCDEQLDPQSASGLRAYLEKLPGHVELVLVTMQMCRDDGRPYQRFLAERLWRAGRGIYFEGGMHNWLNVSEGMKRVAEPSIVIHHNRAAKDETSRKQRADQRVQMAENHFLPRIEQNPNDRRSMFYLAGTYYDAGRIEEAVRWFLRYLEVSDFPEERYQAAILCAQGLKAMGQRETAKQLLSRYIVDNYRRNEAYMLLGQYAREEGKLDEAEWWFKLASLRPMPVDPLFVDVDSHTWQPHQALWEIYRDTGQIDRALEHGRMALENKTPLPAEIIKFEKNFGMSVECQKIAVCIDRGQDNFVKPLIDYWRSCGREVRVANGMGEVEALRDWKPDIVWHEWCSEMTVWFSKQPKESRHIVRVHGYEAETGILAAVNWAHIDSVIFVANFLKDVAISQVPAIAEFCNVHVIHGGVDTDHFTIPKNWAELRNGTKVCMAAYGNSRKNLPLALQIMAKLPKEYTFHLVTEWQELGVLLYFQHMVGELGLKDRVFVYPRQQDLNEWFADKDVYLSTSTRETFCYSLAEAMAAGLRPVIHNWQSAKDFYESEWIFNTVDEAVQMIQRPAHPHVFRSHVVSNLDVGRNIRRIERVVSRPTVVVVDRKDLPRYALAYKLAGEFHNFGCRTLGENPDLVVAIGLGAKREDWMKRAVYWSTEILTGEDPEYMARRQMVQQNLPAWDVVFVHNPLYADLFREWGAKRVEYLPCAVVSWPFRKIENLEKLYDVGFCGVLTERRHKVLDELGQHFDVTVLQNQDHEEVCRFYNQCKVVVNIHATDDPNLETRLGEAMGSGACVVTEDLPEGHGIAILNQQKGNLIDRIKYQLENDRWKETAQVQYEYAMKYMLLSQAAEKILDVMGE